GSKRSARPKKVLISVPVTKPICTAPVSNDPLSVLIWPVLIRFGTTAEAENHSVIQATWAPIISATEIVLWLNYSPLQPVSARGMLILSQGNVSMTFQPIFAP